MRIKNEIVNRLIKDMTGLEMSLYITLAQFQEPESNVVTGIKEIEIRDQLGLGVKTFFKLIKGLQDKGFIKIDYNHTDKCMWKLELIGNNFPDGEIKDFVNINNHYFHTLEFHKMKRNAKKLCLKMLQQYRPGLRSAMTYTFAILKEWTGLKLTSSVISVLNQVKALYKSNITVDERKYKIILYPTVPFARRGDEKNIFHEYYLDYLLKRHRISEIKQNISDVVNVMKKYTGYVISVPGQVIKITFKEIVSIINAAIEEKQYLNPSYIHKNIIDYIENLKQNAKLKHIYQI